MMETDSLAQKDLPPKRSVWLSLLIILTFLGTGITFIIIAASAVGGSFSSFLRDIPVLDTMLTEDSAGGWLYALVKMLALAASLTGAIYMWKMKKRGFWFYFAAQAVLLLLPFIFLMNLGLNYLLVRLLVNTIFALFFIILYSLHLKKMN